MHRRVIGFFVVMFGLLVALACPASAHIEPTPEEAVAGAAAEITLAVEHGCNETEPTTQLEVQLPEGSSEIVAVEKPGFQAAVDGEVITWSGGSAGEHDEPFSFTAVMPDLPGETVYFKTIQTCGATEVAWIEEPGPDGAEPELPAAAITLVAAPDDGSTTTSSSVASSTTATTAAPNDPGDRDADDDSNGWVLPVVALVAIVVIGGGLLLRRRASR